MDNKENNDYNTLSILSIIFMFVFTPVGIVLGIIALNQINKTGEKGKSLARFAVGFPIAIGLILLIFFLIGILIGN